MLGIMRKYKESIVIKAVFVIIVLSFVGTIFLVWGKGDEGFSGSKSYAAKVNGTKISLEQFDRTRYNLKNVYEQIYGRSLSAEMEKQLGIRRLALDNLIEAVLVKQEAKNMSIQVSKEELKAAIATVPNFQSNGAFDFKLYQQFLKAQRITPDEFEQGKKEELMIKKARQQIMDKAQVSDDEALAFFKKQNDKVEIEFASFSPAEVRNEVKLTEQDLTAYLQSHQDQFKTQEQISVSYLVIDPAKVASGKVSATDDEIQTFYQRNIDRYQGKGGILPFSEVKDNAKADLLKTKSAKLAYEVAADNLNKYLKTADIDAAAKGLGTTVQETPLFTAKAPATQLAGEPEVVKRALALKQGELGGPVETPRGIFLIKIKERKPAAVPPVAQIKGALEAAATQDKAQELAKKKTEEALAAFTKNTTPGKVQLTGLFGYSDKSPVVPNIGPSPEIMEAVFTLTSQAPAAKTPFKIGDRWYALRLKNRIAADASLFQQTKDQLKKSMLPKKQQETVDAWLKELKAKAKIDTNKSLIAD